MGVEVHHGDSREVLKSIPDNSIDSVVTDPPYALVSIVKRFGGATAKAGQDYDASGPYARASAGFMGQTWDTGETAFAVEFWAEVMRVLKPGGHIVAASGTRTYHRLAVAIEDAGFEIRDMISWLYGSGFPKSHDVSKGIDRAAGHERGMNPDFRNGPNTKHGTKGQAQIVGGSAGDNKLDQGPATPEAAQWEGWGTALKPACEPWVLARKPLESTVAGNVLTHGTGALNIDGCRVGTEDRPVMIRTSTVVAATSMAGASTGATASGELTSLGRWPANVILSWPADTYRLSDHATAEQREEIERALAE